MPGPKQSRGYWSLPLLGDVLPFLRDKTGFLRTCHLERGDQVRLNIGKAVWLINDPEDVGHILAGNAHNYEKTPKLTSRRGRRLSGHGLHTATREDHLAKRRAVQPMFARHAVCRQADSINRLAGVWLTRRQDREQLDLFAHMMTLTQHVMLEALLGDDFHDPDGHFAAAVTARRAYIEFFFISNLPFPEFWPAPVVRRYRRARRYLRQRLSAEIRRRRGSDLAGSDFLDMLLVTRDREGEPLDDARVIDEALTITSTGYETVGAALSWAGHLLASHPAWQQAVYEEVASVAGSGMVDAESVTRLELTRRVFDETLRLYPPTWLFVRQAVADDTLPSGTRIQAGEKIFLCPFTMHRHPDWYRDPERFDPDRFSDAALKARPRYSFFPFGGGTRLCIGEPFARLEAMILLARIIREFELVPAGDGPVTMNPGIVLEPRGGLQMRLRSRTAT